MSCISDGNPPSHDHTVRMDVGCRKQSRLAIDLRAFLAKGLILPRLCQTSTFLVDEAVVAQARNWMGDQVCDATILIPLGSRAVRSKNDDCKNKAKASREKVGGFSKHRFVVCVCVCMWIHLRTDNFYIREELNSVQSSQF